MQSSAATPLLSRREFRPHRHAEKPQSGSNKVENSPVLAFTMRGAYFHGNVFATDLVIYQLLH